MASAIIIHNDLIPWFDFQVKVDKLGDPVKISDEELAKNRDIKETVFSFFATVLKEHGPLHIEDAIIRQELENFPSDAQDIINGCGGIGQFLSRSLQFVHLNDFVCLMVDASKVPALAEARKKDFPKLPSAGGAGAPRRLPPDTRSKDHFPTLGAAAAEPTPKFHAPVAKASGSYSSTVQPTIRETLKETLRRQTSTPDSVSTSNSDPLDNFFNAGISLSQTLSQSSQDDNKDKTDVAKSTLSTQDSTDDKFFSPSESNSSLFMPSAYGDSKSQESSTSEPIGAVIMSQLKRAPKLDTGLVSAPVTIDTKDNNEASTPPMTSPGLIHDIMGGAAPLQNKHLAMFTGKNRKLNEDDHMDDRKTKIEVTGTLVQDDNRNLETELGLSPDQEETKNKMTNGNSQIAEKTGSSLIPEVIMPRTIQSDGVLPTNTRSKSPLLEPSDLLSNDLLPGVRSPIRSTSPIPRATSPLPEIASPRSKSPHPEDVLPRAKSPIPSEPWKEALPQVKSSSLSPERAVISPPRRPGLTPEQATITPPARKLTLAQAVISPPKPFGMSPKPPSPELDILGSPMMPHPDRQDNVISPPKGRALSPKPPGSEINILSSPLPPHPDDQERNTPSTPEDAESQKPAEPSLISLPTTALNASSKLPAWLNLDFNANNSFGELTTNPFIFQEHITLYTLVL